MVQEAMTEWRTAMGAMEVEPDPVLRHQQVRFFLACDLV